MITVYIDILFFVNLVQNVFIFGATRLFCPQKTRPWRIFSVSALASLWAVCLFYPDLSLLASLGAKLLVSAVLVGLAFGFRPVKSYGKSLLVFYLVSFAFGGAAFALLCLTGLGASLGAVTKNGVFYVNLPMGLLFVASACCYGAIRLGIFALKTIVRQRNLRKSALVKLGDKQTEICVLFDTGCQLKDPAGGAPVLVASLGAVKPLLPAFLCQALNEGGAQAAFDALTVHDYALSVRCIPFRAVGKAPSLLFGFVPDSVAFLPDGPLARGTVIAVSEEGFQAAEGFNALAGQDFYANFC